jgi:hypothetical protein
MTRRFFCKVLLVVIAIFGILVFPSVLMAQGRSEDALEHAKAVQEKHTDILMARPGVAGTAVGLNDAGEYAVLVLLEIPGVAGIPQELEGVPVQTVVTDKIVALTMSRFDRPVPIGVSTGHPDITAGTIGCRVTDGSDVYALSNNHVYANSNEASFGDDVIQPGTYDGGSLPNDYIGTLADFEPIVFSRRARNEIDAAIASTTVDLLDNATPTGGYGTPNSTIVEAFIGQQVQKFGRTTGLTTGEVTGVNATVNVGYGPGKTAKFVKQILIRSGGFSDGGDSGSLIVTNDEFCNPVGLLFAGSSTTTVANRIDLVLDRFGVTVDGKAVPSNDPPTVSITSPANGSTFDTGANISFAGTASDTEDGDLTASLVWTSSIDNQIGTGGNFSAILSDGNHTITAEVTDSGGKTASESISITVGTPPSGDVKVDSIVFSSKVAGPNKFLYTTVTVVDGDSYPLEGVWVEMTLTHESAGSWNFAGDTGINGTVKFTLGKAPIGHYYAEVTNLIDGNITADCILNEDGSIDQ